MRTLKDLTKAQKITKYENMIAALESYILWLQNCIILTRRRITAYKGHLTRVKINR